MNIEEYIPTGKDNAISRRQLVTLTRLTDRDVRRLINLARRTTVIISADDGSGYYLPTEYEELRQYYARESARAGDIYKNLRVVAALMEDMEHGRIGKL